MIEVTSLRVETIKSENEFTSFALKENYEADYLDHKFLFSRNCVINFFSLLTKQKNVSAGQSHGRKCYKQAAFDYF